MLKVPSHHGPDVMTVKPEIQINSMAVAVPTTIMHVHVIVAQLPEGHGLDTDKVLDMWSNEPRNYTDEWVRNRNYHNCRGNGIFTRYWTEMGRFA